VATDFELIKKIDFFEQLEDKIVKKITEVCIPREYSAGDHIVTQGETGLGLFFITSGKVKVETDHNGSKVVVAQLKEEDFFGELAIIDNKPRSANIICLENTTCLLLTRDSFSKLMNKYPEIAVQMAKSLAARVRATTEKIGTPVTITATATPPVTITATTAVPAGSAATPSASSTAEAPAALPPAPTEATPLPPASNGSSTKNRVKDFLVNTFSQFYTVKAMTRFSVALVGCPVTVRSEEPALEVACGDVGEMKIIVFPAHRLQGIRITGLDDGQFSATILRPSEGAEKSAFSISQLEGQVRRHDRLRLHVPGRDGEIRLEVVDHC
jgi:CRP-like cAMP-binding protein